jgi:cell wall assembly regulator SMI1
VRRVILIVVFAIAAAGCQTGGRQVQVELTTRPRPSLPTAIPTYVHSEPARTPHPPGALCPTGRPPEPPRATDQPAVTARVNRAWDRIERWLRAYAPATLATLNPPASARRVRAAEAEMSVGFPADLVASLRRHDGARTTNLYTVFQLPPMYGLMSLDDLRRDWRTRCGIIERAGDQPGWWWHAKFVPFAQDFGGDVLVVDQRPEGGGRFGLHSHEDGMHFEGERDSLVSLLEQTARALESGQPYGRYRAEVNEAGGLDWVPA